MRLKKLIELTEELRYFHQATIDGRENEKTALALNIHDELLNQLAVFSLNTPQAAPEFQEQINMVDFVHGAKAKNLGLTRENPMGYLLGESND